MKKEKNVLYTIIFTILIFINVAIWSGYLLSVQFFDFSKWGWILLQVIFMLSMIGFMFWKSEKKIKVVFMVILAVGMIGETVLFPFSGGIRSYTNKVEHYLILDEALEAEINEDIFVFPPKIEKENCMEVRYSYEYMGTLDEEGAIFLAQTFKDESAYQKEKERIETNHKFVYEYEKENEKMLFTAYSNTKDVFCIFNDDLKEIRYGFYTFGLRKTLDEYLEL